jgi:hypothetical protein
MAVVSGAAPVTRLEPAFTVRAVLGPLEDHGATRAGHRRIVPVAGGQALRVAVHLGTAAPRLAELERSLFIASAVRAADSVSYTAYRVTGGKPSRLRRCLWRARGVA